MAPRPLGNTGLHVSRIGLGTVKLGRNTAVKYPRPFDLPSDAQVAALLAGALDLGVTLLDTAPAYGSSESRLAPFLALNRPLVVLSTKFGETFENGVSRHDFSSPALRASLDASLLRLGVPSVDLLLLHSDGKDLDRLAEGGMEALLAAKASGKARAIGISAKTPDGIRRALQGLDVVMAPLSRQAPALAAPLREAHEAGLGVIAIKVLDSGNAVEAPAAIRWVLDQGFVDSAVIGTLSLEHLAQAVRAAGGAA
ncbi:MAG: aldo/keto reductase [Candidatus Brocadiae bacterium]|nr:aldo/keto reductase [Candidatus Brocadiia bacterium]